MSAYSEQVTQFSEASLLVAALKALGLTVVEHAVPQEFSRWTNDTASIVVPSMYDTTLLNVGRPATKKVNVNPGSYPVGFSKGANGTFGALVSEEDARHIYDAAWMNRVKQSYAQVGLMRQAERQGLKLIGKATGKDGVTRLQYQHG